MAEDAQVLAGIVVDRQCEPQAAVQVLLDAGDGRDPSHERDVEHVRPRLRPQPDSIARLQRLCDRAQLADGAVQPRYLFRREPLGPLDEPARARVAHGLPLLLLGQREDAQREDLVDLRGIEEVPWALRGDLRMVVQDDRRREHGVGPAHQHRPPTLVVAGPRCLERVGGRIEQRDELAAGDTEQDVRRDHRLFERGLAGRVGRQDRFVLRLDAQAREPLRFLHPLRPCVALPFHRLGAAHFQPTHRSLDARIRAAHQHLGAHRGPLCVGLGPAR